jgi:hypothetical protein
MIKKFYQFTNESYCTDLLDEIEQILTIYDNKEKLIIYIFYN